MNKRILILSLTLVLALALAGFIACNSDLTVTVESCEHGTVTASVNTAEAGDEVTLTLTADSGYYAESVTVNDAEQQIEDNKAVFIMPSVDVTVKAVFAQRKYAINIADTVGGQVFAEEKSYAAGESVTLKVIPSFGYKFVSFTVDGASANLTDTAYTFIMPGHDVAAKAEFNTDLQPKALPAGSVAQLSSNAPAGAQATANLYVDFQAEALVVTAYVADKTVTATDRISLYFGNSQYANGGISSANLCVSNIAVHGYSVKEGSANGFVNASTDGVKVETSPWSKDAGVVTGYIMTFTVSYSRLGVTQSTAQKTLTMLPYLANCDRDGIAFGATEATFDQYYTHANADTYPLVNANGFVDNPNMFGQGQMGSYKDAVVMGGNWNNSNDFPATDDKYSERKVTLNGHDGADNNIAFLRSAGATSFAKATFKVNALHNKGERFPKFGIMVYDVTSANSGIFFYVDAYMTEDKTGNFELADIVGTQLGYAVQQNGDWRSWTTLDGTNGMFNVLTKEITLAVCYNNGFVYFYVERGGNDILVGVTTFKAQDGIVLGIKSFGLGLDVTNYTSTNNPDSADYKNHNKRADGTTVGDNDGGYAYTEGWSFTGDVAVNEGGGDQVVYVKAVKPSADFYAQADVITPSKAGNTGDEYTKVGAVIKNDNYTIFGYIDLEDRAGRGNRVVTNFAVRSENGSTAGQWLWEIGVSGRVDVDIETTTAAIGIAKLGAKVYLIVNGKVVATYINNEIAEQAFVAGIMGFNRNMTVTNGSGTVKEEEIKQNIGLKTAANVKFDGVLDDAIWTEQVLNAKQTFAQDETTGTRVEIAAVKGSDGVYVALTLYTKTMQRHFANAVAWSDVANVEFRLTPMTNSNKNDKNLTNYIAFHNYLDGGITSSVGILNAEAKVEGVKLKDGSDGYKTVVEFFIPLSSYVGYGAWSTELPLYVWSCTFDDNNMPAMNRLFNTTDMLVTEQGIVLRENTEA